MKEKSGTGIKQSDRLQGSLIVLHGPPKIGKTQLASKFPGPVVFIATEPGHRYLPQEQQDSLIRIDPETGWQQFKDIKKLDMKTLVIDTVAGLYSACMEYICKKNNWDHPEDAGHGKGWAAVKREFYFELTRVLMLAQKKKATVIMIAHTKTEEVTTATSKTMKVVVNLPGQARSLVMPVPDHIWFLGYDENEGVDSLKNFQNNRCLWIKGTDVVEAGCRDPEVIINTIKPLHKNDPYNQILKGLNKRKDV